MKTSFARFLVLGCLITSLHAAGYQPADKVEILWGSSWYPGEVLEAKDGKFKIHYDNHSASWDEWVGPERLREPSAPSAPAPAASGAWKVGDRVEALSIGSWYAGRIVAAEANRWKVTYDGYSASADEWLTADKLRPGAPPKGPAAKPVAQTYAFPARPAGKKAGLEGAWLRVESVYWGSNLSLSNQGWFFTKDGRFSRAPTGGFDFKDFGKGPARKTDGNYWIEGDKLHLQWADGSQTTEYGFARKGDELVLGGIGSTPVEGFKKGWRFDGEYEGGASVGGGAVANSNTLVFRKDGSFGSSSIGSIRSDSPQSTVSAGSQTQGGGTYEFDGYTLVLLHADGQLAKHTVFAFGDRDRAGRPEYIYRDGTMLRRQD